MQVRDLGDSSAKLRFLFVRREPKIPRKGGLRFGYMH